MATSTTTSTTTAVTTRDMVQSRLYLSMPRIPPKVYLETVNPHITCNLCKGYLIDATTIVECLHSFCHSCIMMHLRHETYCPSCEMLINKVKVNIKPDATLQAIVYKLVPGLYEKELLRRRAFYKIRTKEALEATPEQRGDDTEHLIFGPNESISLMLEYSDNDSAPQNSDDENSNSSHEINSSDHCDQDDFEVQLRKPKYLQCPAIFTISNLKKFLLHKFSINPNKFCVEIMYKVKPLLLPDHYTLMDVAYIFTWKRDAPMKFLYCVRAAHSPVANIEQSAVMYDLPPNHFQTNSQLVCASDSTDHEQDQSSDADSEARSERTKEPETNGSTGRQSQHGPINSTSDEPSITPSSSTTSTTMKTMSSATVTSTVASTSSSKSSSQHTSQVNGSENQKKESTTATKEPTVSSPTTSGRMDITLRIKSEPTSPSPEKPQSDRRSNGASPKPNTSKSKTTNDAKPSSPSRTNQDLKDSKEKVKTKSIMLDSSATKSGDTTSNRSESKTVTFSDRPSSSSSSVRPSVESRPTSSSERPKGRLFFNKEEKAKSLSPPISAENEYDFDQHLLKEEFSTKKDFFEKIHLKPRTDSPLVQLPKMPKTEQKSDTALPTTNLSKDKDKDTNKISVTTTTATTTVTVTATATATTTATNTSASSVRPSVSSSSINFSAAFAAAIVAVDDKQAKKPENKTSKRKSREPVKNVAKVKCASPNERSIDTKWDSSKSSVLPSSLVSTVTPSNATSSSTSSSSGSSNSVADRIRRLQDPAAMAQLLGQLAQTNKNHLKSIKSSASSSTTKPNQQASSSTSTQPNSSSSSSLSSSLSKSVFKTPITSSSKESSSSIGLKPNTSESETSIIINNVPRPTQADTPRPSMSSFKPNLAGGQPPPFFFKPPLNRSFGSETEIQEIRNDDASKLVYGPTMSLPKPFESIPNLTAPGLLALQHLMFTDQLSQLQMSQMGQISPIDFQRLNMYNKTNKSKKQLDPKRPSASGGGSSGGSGGGSLETKANSLQKTFHPTSRSIIAADAQCDSKAKQQNVPHGFRLPPSTQIFATNEENEQSFSRSLYNKNSNVKNSIEIVKLPDESGNELNSKFPSVAPALSSSSTSPSPSSSSGDKSWQSNKNANNQTKHVANQQNNQIDSTSTIAQLATTSSNFQDSSFQAKFIDSLKTPPQPKPPQINRATFNVDDASRNQETQKRKLQQQQQIDDIWPVAKSRKLQPTVPQQQPSLTTQRPVPGLLIPKDDRKVTVSNSNSSSSGGGNGSGSSTQAQLSSSNTNPLVNNKSAPDRKSPTVPSNAALTLAAKLQQVANESATSKYQPLQTSTTPMWANHCTIEHKASHKSMAETLSMVEKKNSSTYVD